MEQNIASPYKSFFEICGWLLSFAAPLGVYYTLSSYNADYEVTLFLSVLSSAVLMWTFQLFQEFIPGLFIVIATLFLSLVPAHTVLSGFSSETFIMIFSVLCITVVIARSGIIDRFLLILLKKTASNPSRIDKCFYLVFAFLTPFIPSIISRTQLAAKCITDFVELLGIKHKSETADRLAISSFFGSSIFSSLFLTSSLMNFVVLALLPLQEQLRFSFVGWLKASLLAGAVLLIGYIILYSLFFIGKKEVVKMPPAFAANKLKALGSFSKDEWTILSVIALSFVGMLTFSIHKISPTWIEFAAVYILLTFDILDRKNLQEGIDWPFLIFMAAIVGVSASINYLNIDAWLALKLQAFIFLFSKSIYVLFGFVAVACLALRLLLPIGAAAALLITVFVPLATVYGISPWTISFAILMLVDTWFFPYQCIFYTSFKEGFPNEILPYNEIKFLFFNGGMNLVRIAAVIASIYYWQWLGIL